MGLNKEKSSGIKKIRITLIKGLAGKKKRQRRTIKALGLKKLHSTVIKENNSHTRGMIVRVAHMVKVDKFCARGQGEKMNPVPLHHERIDQTKKRGEKMKEGRG